MSEQLGHIRDDTRGSWKVEPGSAYSTDEDTPSIALWGLGLSSALIPGPNRSGWNDRR